MKVFEIRNDWGLGNLGPATRPMPEPGPREVLLRLRATTLNYRDKVVVEGNYGKLAGDLPLIPLSDGVGEVSFSPADGVAFDFDLRGGFGTDAEGGLRGRTVRGRASRLRRRCRIRH